MNFMNVDEHIKEFYDYAVHNGFSKEQFFSHDNLNGFIDTSIDGYSDYPLFMHVFENDISEKILRRMMNVDYRSRLNMMAGMASDEDFNSVMMIEPPLAKKIGMKEYVKIAHPADYALLFKKQMYRQEEYESFAFNKRKELLDDKTWYMYVFVTKKNEQRKGHGKKLMNLMLKFADEKGYRIVLETDLKDNVPMYEKFGFTVMGESVYKDELNHYVMRRMPLSADAAEDE